MATITENQFRSICDDAYRDRQQIYGFNPSAPPAETVLWVILGSLFSLLDLSDDQVPVLADPSARSYADAISKLVKAHREGEFEPDARLIELIRKLEAETEPLK